MKTSLLSEAGRRAGLRTLKGIMVPFASIDNPEDYQFASKSMVSLSGASSFDSLSICITTGVWKAVPDSTHAPEGSDGIRDREELSRLFKEFFNRKISLSLTKRCRK